MRRLFPSILLLARVSVLAAGSPYVTQWPNGDVPGPNRFTNKANSFVGTLSVSGLIANRPFVDTNHLYFSGFTTSVGVDVSYLNGVWTYNNNGTFVHNATNGYYFDAVNQAAWLVTNALYPNGLLPAVVPDDGNQEGMTNPSAPVPATNYYGSDLNTYYTGSLILYGTNYVVAPLAQETTNFLTLGPTAAGYRAGVAGNNFTTNQNPLVTTLGFDTTLSNMTWAALCRPPTAVINPIATADQKGRLMVLQFGDSTCEYYNSPVQQASLMLMKRYGCGGWGSLVYGGSSLIVCQLGGIAYGAGDQTHGYQSGNGGNLWCTVSGGVTSSNSAGTGTGFSSVWGQTWCGLPAGGTILFTNDAVNAIPTPNGSFPGATRCAVWYTMTNGLGSFAIQTSTNGGPFGTQMTVNCSQTAGVAQVMTNAVIVFTNAPTKNSYKMQLVGLSGTSIIQYAGMWNDFAGATIFRMCLGAWAEYRIFQPDPHVFYPGTPWPNPVVANLLSFDNLMSPLKPDLTMCVMANTGPDLSSGTYDPTATYTNFATMVLGLSSEFHKFNPNELTVWIGLSPQYTNQGYWPWMSEALRTIFATNWTGYDYVHYTGEDSTPERWGPVLSHDSPWVHWSNAGGQYVANEIMRRLASFGTVSPQTQVDANGLPYTSLLGTRFVPSIKEPTAASLGVNGWQIWASPTNAIWIYQSPDGVTLNTKIIANF